MESQIIFNVLVANDKLIARHILTLENLYICKVIIIFMYRICGRSVDKPDGKAVKKLAFIAFPSGLSTRFVESSTDPIIIMLYYIVHDLS